MTSNRTIAEETYRLPVILDPDDDDPDDGMDDGTVNGDDAHTGKSHSKKK
jgi:hypothetical protein